MLLSGEMRKETRKALQEAKKEIVEQVKLRQMLVNHNTDFSMLEQFIQSVNNNPGLKIKITTKAGTVVEIETTQNRQKTYTEILGEMD